MELNSTQVLPLSNHSLAFAPSFVLSFVPLFRRVSRSLSLPLALSFSPFSLSLSCTLSLSPSLLFSYSLTLSLSLSYPLSLLYPLSLIFSLPHSLRRSLFSYGLSCLYGPRGQL
jgi:hypothetical protein